MAQCGSCTVVVGREAVRACTTPLKDIEGKSVTTIEGLMQNDKLHAVQEAFVKHAALQCGYCTPGMVMEAYALLLNNPRATRADIVQEFEGHACRCGAHVRILAAVEEAAAAARR
jgi:carbon-monoxide dehydrogenase small subunit